MKLTPDQLKLVVEYGDLTNKLADLEDEMFKVTDSRTEVVKRLRTSLQKGDPSAKCIFERNNLRWVVTMRTRKDGGETGFIRETVPRHG